MGLRMAGISVEKTGRGVPLPYFRMEQLISADTPLSSLRKSLNAMHDRILNALESSARMGLSCGVYWHETELCFSLSWIPQQFKMTIAG